MCHKGVVITLENVATLEYSPDIVDRLLPGRPVVLRFFALKEHVNVVF